MAESNPKPAVLVVGAGPVGLAAAWALARHGASVRVIEREKARSGTSRALLLWSRTLEVLDALDAAGGAAPFVAAAHRLRGATIRGRKVKVNRDLNFRRGGGEPEGEQR